MTAATITLNVGTGGDKPLVDTLTTVDGVAAPTGASAQMVKMGHGAPSDFKTASVATPLPFTALGNGFISIGNSTSVALAANGVFIGVWEEITEQNDVRVTTFSDQPSATDGLSLQQSSNGTNADIVDAYTIPASSGKVFSVAGSAKFYRTVYTNGVTAQTVLRLQTKYQKGYGKGSSVRPQDGRGRDNDMEEVLGYAMHYDGTNWNMQRGSIANGLAVDVTRLPALVAGVAVIGALVANQSVNKAQINGVAPLMGNGVSGTGSQRVNIASDNTAFPVNATLQTGANTIGAVTGPAAAPLSLDSTQTNHTQRFQAVTTLTTLSTANTAVTLTLPAVAAQFHYITRIRISMHNTSAAAVVGSAVTLAFSSTNIPGALAWTEGNALAAGISKLVCDEVLTNSIKSSVVNTASTIVAPACGAGVLVRITAYFYTAA